MILNIFGEEKTFEASALSAIVEALIRVVANPDDLALAEAQNAIDQAGLDEVQATMVEQEAEA